MEPCNASKNMIVYDYAILDLRTGEVLENEDGSPASGKITAENEADAKIELAREFPDVKARAIHVKEWTRVSVANPDAIATVRVINADPDSTE